MASNCQKYPLMPTVHIGYAFNAYRRHAISKRPSALPVTNAFIILPTNKQIQEASRNSQFAAHLLAGEGLRDVERRAGE